MRSARCHDSSGFSLSFAGGWYFSGTSSIMPVAGADAWFVGSAFSRSERLLLGSRLPSYRDGEFRPGKIDPPEVEGQALPVVFAGGLTFLQTCPNQLGNDGGIGMLRVAGAEDQREGSLSCDVDKPIEHFLARRFLKLL